MGLILHLISICVILVAYEIIRDPLHALKETIQSKLTKMYTVLKETASRLKEIVFK